jgi:hypothetical protein
MQFLLFEVQLLQVGWVHERHYACIPSSVVLAGQAQNDAKIRWGFDVTQASQDEPFEQFAQVLLHTHEQSLMEPEE